MSNEGNTVALPVSAEVSNSHTPESVTFEYKNGVTTATIVVKGLDVEAFTTGANSVAELLKTMNGSKSDTLEKEQTAKEQPARHFQPGVRGRVATR